MPKQKQAQDAQPTKLSIVYKPIGEIKPYENNPRFNDEAVEKVANSIKCCGWDSAIVVDKDFVIIAGHTRLKAAMMLGLSEVPVIVRDDLSPALVKVLRLADNKTGEIATWDWELLDEELKEIGADFDMAEFGFTDSDFSGLDNAMDRTDVVDNGEGLELGTDKYLLSLKLPAVHRPTIERYRKENGDGAINRAVLNVCGIAETEDA